MKASHLRRLPTIAAFAIVIVLIVAALFATRFGIAIRALHDDEVAADLMGVHVRAIQVAAFTIGSIIAGIGGGSRLGCLGRFRGGLVGHRWCPFIRAVG